MRKKKLAKNTISSLIFQVTTIVCGFILPRLILLYYGSETNGLVNSITQFLSIISFLELGVGAVVAAIMNITVSIVLVKAAGLIGVAIGTLVAMLYQTVWMANYDSKNLICWPLRKFMKQIFVDVLSVVCFSFCVRFLNLQAQNYLQWIYNAVKVVTVAVAITGVINWIFYRDKEKKLLSKIIKR